MPIYNYFSEYIPRSNERDQEYRGKLREEAWERQKAAAASAKEAMNIGRKLTDEDALRFLDLHLRGYSNGAISLMLNVPEYKVYHMMQMPLARYIAGERGREVLIGKKEQTVYPKVEAIKEALEEYGIAEDEWLVDMRKNGMSKIQLNKMLGVRKGKVNVKYAVAAACYFKKNVDELFAESEKEK
ncbi:MAG: hypothetical protein ACI4PP_02950 [Clostridia bacterium]